MVDRKRCVKRNRRRGRYGEVEFVELNANEKTQILITSLFLVVRKWVSFAAYVYPYPPHD